MRIGTTVNKALGSQERGNELLRSLNALSTRASKVSTDLIQNLNQEYIRALRKGQKESAELLSKKIDDLGKVLSIRSTGAYKKVGAYATGNMSLKEEREFEEVLGTLRKLDDSIKDAVKLSVMEASKATVKNFKQADLENKKAFADEMASIVKDMESMNGSDALYKLITFLEDNVITKDNFKDLENIMESLEKEIEGLDKLNDIAEAVEATSDNSSITLTVMQQMLKNIKSQSGDLKQLHLLDDILKANESNDRKVDKIIPIIQALKVSRLRSEYVERQTRGGYPALPPPGARNNYPALYRSPNTMPVPYNRDKYMTEARESMMGRSILSLPSPNIEDADWDDLFDEDEEGGGGGGGRRRKPGGNLNKENFKDWVTDRYHEHKGNIVEGLLGSVGLGSIDAALGGVIGSGATKALGYGARKSWGLLRKGAGGVASLAKGGIGKLLSTDIGEGVAAGVKSVLEKGGSGALGSAIKLFGHMGTKGRLLAAGLAAGTGYVGYKLANSDNDTQKESPSIITESKRGLAGEAVPVQRITSGTFSSGQNFWNPAFHTIKNPPVNIRPVNMAQTANIAPAPAGFNSRGYRNNNPGNLRYIGQAGTTGADEKNFAVFANPWQGLRALSSQLNRYYTGATTGNRLLTVHDIIKTYAPSSENPTDSYIASVCKRMGVSPDQKINLNDPKVMASLMKAIMYQENGGTTLPYDDDQILQAAEAGLGLPVHTTKTSPVASDTSIQPAEVKPSPNSTSLTPAATPDLSGTPTDTDASLGSIFGKNAENVVGNKAFDIAGGKIGSIVSKLTGKGGQALASVGNAGKSLVGKFAGTSAGQFLDNVAEKYGLKAGAAALKTGASKIPFLNLGFSGYNAYEDYNSAKSQHGRNSAISGLIGNVAGLGAGAAAGATIGSVIPGFGTVAGGLLGAGLESATMTGGEYLGQKINSLTEGDLAYVPDTVKAQGPNAIKAWLTKNKPNANVSMADINKTALKTFDFTNASPANAQAYIRLNAGDDIMGFARKFAASDMSSKNPAFYNAVISQLKNYSTIASDDQFNGAVDKANTAMQLSQQLTSRSLPGSPTSINNLIPSTTTMTPQSVGANSYDLLGQKAATPMPPQNITVRTVDDTKKIPQQLTPKTHCDDYGIIMANKNILNK